MQGDEIQVSGGTHLDDLRAVVVRAMTLSMMDVEFAPVGRGRFFVEAPTVVYGAGRSEIVLRFGL